MNPSGGPRRVTARSRTALLGPALLAAGLLTALVAGCAPAPTAVSSGGPTAGSPAGPAPRTAPDTAPGTAPGTLPGTSAPQVAAQEVELPWPAATPAAADALQAEVDRGAQPWLLDPSEVAIAYAAAAHGWPDAEAYPGPDGTSVDVRNADGERRTLSLAQPARTGDDGIWVVTADQR